MIKQLKNMWKSLLTKGFLQGTIIMWTNSKIDETNNDQRHKDMLQELCINKGKQNIHNNQQ